MITATLYRKWAIGATGAAVLAGGIAAVGMIGWRMERAENEAQAARVETLELVANSNAAATRTLGQQLAACKDQLGPIVQANENAVQQLNRESLRLVQRLRNLEQERRKLYESEECAVLTRVPVCRDVAHRLRSLEVTSQD